MLALQSAGSVRFEQFGQDLCGAVIRRPRSGEGPTHTQNWNGGLTGLPLGVCVWVWVGSHTNWTGVVGCAFYIYDHAKRRQTQTYVPPYLTIFAFGRDHFGSTSGAFGQLGEQGRWAGTRFWQVWRLERVFSSVRAPRGAGQVGWHAVLAGLAVGWVRSSEPEAEVGR